jgi:hypothetical protein
MMECENILEIVGECGRELWIAVGNVRHEVNQVSEGNDAS